MFSKFSSRNNAGPAVVDSFPDVNSSGVSQTVTLSTADNNVQRNTSSYTSGKTSGTPQNLASGKPVSPWNYSAVSGGAGACNHNMTGPASGGMGEMISGGAGAGGTGTSVTATVVGSGSGGLPCTDIGPLSQQYEIGKLVATGGPSHA